LRNGLSSAISPLSDNSRRGRRRQPSKHLSVRVALWTPTFQPKVILARFGGKSAFAIVGSGNLTGGGQYHNVECGIFLTASDHTGEVEY
jgi:hypothetical protein